MRKHKNLFTVMSLVLIVAVCSLLPHQNNSDGDIPAVRPDEIIVRDYSEYAAVTSAYPTPAAFHKSVDELAEYVECIAKGVYYDDAKQVGLMNSVLERYTVSTFEVTEALKGELSVGDKIPLCESYYIDEAKKAIYHYWNCYPADPGREYLVFMFEPRGNQKSYSVSGLNGKTFARFPVINSDNEIDVDSFTDAELNISTGKTDAGSDEFRFFYEQVIEEYM